MEAGAQGQKLRLSIHATIVAFSISYLHRATGPTMNVPFNIYDFFAYLATRFVLLAAADYSFDGHWALATRQRQPRVNGTSHCRPRGATRGPRRGA